MMFEELALQLEKLENTSSRNEITVMLANLYGSMSSAEASFVVYLLQGRLVPKFTDLEFNISSKLIIQALDEAFDLKESAKLMFNKMGDLGLVVENIITNQNKDLSISEVYEILTDIALLEGTGSQENKKTKYIELIKQLKSKGAKFATRVIIGSLRLGISDKTILDSLSWYISEDKSLRSQLDRAFGVRADIGNLTKLVVESKDIQEDLEKITLLPLLPVASKLVERAKNTEEVWERMPECFVQPKLDGLRGQIHFDGQNEARIYSRNMESLTNQFPELTRDVKKIGKSIILDSEVIGWDGKKYLAFQETMKRRRKYDIAAHSDSIPARAMCFDVLYYDGIDLTRKPIEERLSLLKKILDENKTESLFMLETKQARNQIELNEYFEKNIYSGLEGIIAKQSASIYEPGTRNFAWIKLKANTKSDLVDTLDVVVLGYYAGKGTRSKFGVGTLLAGVYDEKNECYYSIGKVGSGFTDNNLVQIKMDLDEIRIDQKPNNVYVDSTLSADTWVEPKIIMEIIADELTRSSVHLAAKGIKTNVKNDDYTKGISIRFPRMKIWNRKDKDYPTTVSELIRMYELRKGK